MNKGFKTYYKEGMKNASLTLKRKGNLLRYYLFLMTSIFSIICPFLLPVINMAYFKLARQVKYDHQIEVCQLIKPGDNYKNYWTIFVVSLMKFLLFIAMIVMIAILIALSFLLGYAISLFVEESSGIIPIATAVPAAVLLVVFLCVYPFATVPEGFLVENTDGENSSKVLFDSLHALNKTGKRTLFATYLVQGLITIGILAVAIIVPIIPSFFIDGSIGVAIMILLALVSLVLLIRYLPVFDLAFSTARFSLFEDLTTDKYKASQRIKGVTIKGLEAIGAEDALVTLFEHQTTRKPRPAEVVKNVKEIKKLKETTETPVKTSKPVSSLPVVEEKPEVVEEIKVAEETTVDVIEEEVVNTPPTVDETPIIEESESSLESTPIATETVSIIDETPVIEEAPAEVIIEEKPVVIEENAIEEEKLEEVLEAPAEEEIIEENVIEEEKPEEVLETSIAEEVEVVLDKSVEDESLEEETSIVEEISTIEEVPSNPKTTTETSKTKVVK